jgi:polyphosphate kinase 2 (PPK2 family)
MIELRDIATIPKEEYSKEESNKEMKTLHNRLFELQNVFFADARFSMLVFFQALDTAGKDGSIRHVKNDTAVAHQWEDYMKVYNMIVNTCNCPEWHIIPADKRWYRNYAVAKVLTKLLESLHLKFPTHKME